MIIKCEFSQEQLEVAQDSVITMLKVLKSDELDGNEIDETYRDILLETAESLKVFGLDWDTINPDEDENEELDANEETV